MDLAAISDLAHTLAKRNSPDGAVSTPPDASGEAPSEVASPQANDADRMEESEDEENSGESHNTTEKPHGKGSRSGKVKKKKGTKFHCTGFGDCHLSFTRSEHLARHIR